jgi:hypothetical protein
MRRCLQTISTITDRVIEGMSEWQNRPLDPVYPVVFIDAIKGKIRDGNVTPTGRSTSRSASPSTAPAACSGCGPTRRQGGLPVLARDLRCSENQSQATGPTRSTGWLGLLKSSVTHFGEKCSKQYISVRW